MTATPDEATSGSSADLDEARLLAEHGRLDQAARIYQRILDGGALGDRAAAALGLAVVLEEGGDHEGARAADQMAVATGDPEYGARAAYHLALSHGRAGHREDAGRAWRAVVDFGNPEYLPPALMALAQLAEEEGDGPAALYWWERAVASGDPHYAPVAVHELATRLLETGETARAQQVLEAALGADPDPQARARLAVTLGIAHLDQAIAALGEVTPNADGEVSALATELLARALPLRGREEAAEQVWRRGLTDPRPDVAEAVRMRVLRAFDLDDPSPWWHEIAEAAVEGVEPGQ